LFHALGGKNGMIGQILDFSQKPLLHELHHVQPSLLCFGFLVKSTQANNQRQLNYELRLG
jgi:hypothetical protein